MLCLSRKATLSLAAGFRAQEDTAPSNESRLVYFVNRAWYVLGPQELSVEVS